MMWVNAVLTGALPGVELGILILVNTKVRITGLQHGKMSEPIKRDQNSNLDSVSG
jgi:hypothetical protein